MLNRELHKKENAKWNTTFLSVALNSQKASNPWERGRHGGGRWAEREAAIGEDAVCYFKEEEPWKQIALDWNTGRKTIRQKSLSYGREERSDERRGLGLAPNHPQEPWVKLTVRDELVNSLIHLMLKFFTRTAWRQSPTRTHVKRTEGTHGNPKKELLPPEV